MRTPVHSFSVVTRTWAPEIILALDDRPLGFNELLRSVGAGDDRQISPRLRQLEDHGLISRQVVVGPPVRVWYGLTPAGRRYINPLTQLAAVEVPVEAVEPQLKQLIAAADAACGASTTEPEVENLRRARSAFMNALDQAETQL